MAIEQKFVFSYLKTPVIYFFYHLRNQLKNSVKRLILYCKVRLKKSTYEIKGRRKFFILFVL